MAEKLCDLKKKGSEQLFLPCYLIHDTEVSGYLVSGVQYTLSGSVNWGAIALLYKRATAINVTVPSGSSLKAARDNNGSITVETISAGGSIANPKDVIAIYGMYKKTWSITATF